MKQLFSKIEFQKPKGGNLYEYTEAETTFMAPNDGLFVIKVVASAKNAEQNNSTDDDDLRMTIDDYAFGKYESNKEQLSFKGFNTSASWNGANLKSQSKAVYFFVNLNKGIHTLKFFADNTPTLQSIAMHEIENNNFTLNTSEHTNHQSFIFTNTFPKSLVLNYDGLLSSNNLNLFINGKKFTRTEIQDKILTDNALFIENEDIIGHLPFENSVEIYIKNTEDINSLEIKFNNLKNIFTSIKYIENYLFTTTWLAILFFKYTKQTYSAKLLQYALNQDPRPLIFKENHPIVKVIKLDPAFKLITDEITKKIKQGDLDGEIIPNNISFETNDLKTAIHGIKKIEYSAKKNKQGRYYIRMVLYDVYDFKYIKLPSILDSKEFILANGNNLINVNEELGFVNNFEIQIFITVIV